MHHVPCIFVPQVDTDQVGRQNLQNLKAEGGGWASDGAGSVWYDGKCLFYSKPQYAVRVETSIHAAVPGHVAPCSGTPVAAEGRSGPRPASANQVGRRTVGRRLGPWLEEVRRVRQVR